MLSISERTSFDARFATLFAIDPKTIIPAGQRHATTIDKVGKGGVVRLGGETFVVQNMATYVEVDEKTGRDGDYTVTELVLLSLKTGETRYLEWSIDDEIEISFTERKLSTAELNRELRDEEGNAFDVDEDIDECADNGWGIKLNGRTYYYDDDYPVRYKAADGRSGKATMYEFGDDTVGWLTIEAWETNSGWEYEGYLSKTIKSVALEIISIGS